MFIDYFVTFVNCLSFPILIIGHFYVYSMHVYLITAFLRWNSHAIKLTLKVCNSVLFYIVTELYNCHSYLISEHVITPKRNPRPISSQSSLLLPPLPVSMNMLSVSMFLPYLISYKSKNTLRGCLWLVFFHLA